MKIQLQKFIHKEAPYSRPNQTWQCGKQAQGYVCEAGADEHGQCRTEFECKPHKIENGWICTRGSQYGGICDEGPLPDGRCCRKIISCQPVRSIRSKRSLFIKWSLLSVFAVLLFLLNSTFKASFFSPGELTFKHGTIEQCSSCHAVFDKGMFSWIVHALSGKNAINNSQKCLDCHQFGENAHQPHGLQPEQLKKIKQGKEEPNDKQLACLNCHREHHGVDSDLTVVVKRDCAYCHQLDQSIMKNKHPEFKQYPYKRNTHIIFDHVIHEKKYYYNRAGDQLLGAAPTSCAACHLVDDRGVKMMLHNYNEACKACHNDVFEEAERFMVFDIPELAFNSEELNVEWPEDASGSLTYYMLILLAADPLFSSVVTQVDDFFDLTALDKQDTIKIITAIKRLLTEIDSHGSMVFQQRLATVFECKINKEGRLDSSVSCPLTSMQLEQLSQLFPLDLFCQGKKRWFADLDKENTTKDPDNQGGYCKNNTFLSEEKIEAGEWVLEELSIEYQPINHQDAFIKSWLNLSTQELSSAFVEKIRKELFDELRSKESAVQCTKCHSVESDDGNNFRVNWSSRQSEPKGKEFIKFKHISHIKYQDETICIECHIENNNQAYLESYQDNNPLTFESNFVTQSKDCSTCHQQSMTKGQCQVCHNYHVLLIH